MAKPKSAAQTAPQSFSWISSDAATESIHVSIDKQRRLYLSADACELLGVSKDAAEAKFYVGYDTVNERIVFGKPGVVRAADVKPHRFDKKRNSSARSIIAKAAINPTDLPLKYVYVGRDYSEVPDGCYVFQLEGTVAPDDGK